MDLDKFLTWYFSHNMVLINLVIVAILALVALALFFSFWKDDSRAPMSSVNGTIDDLEKTLRRVLDSVPLQTAAVAQAVAGTMKDDEVPSAESLVALDSLKKDIAEREKVIVDLRTSIQQLGQKSSLTDDQKARIEQLEKDLASAKSRLTEYEIIEDDIANLSLYKAENTQLKGELEKLRRGKGTSHHGSEDPNGVPAVSEIVAEFAAIVGAEDNPPTLVTPSNANIESPILVSKPGPVPATPAPKPAPKAATPAEAPAGDPLTVDPNKLIAEASTLPEAKDESGPAEEGDTGQKLINEFESFIKNG
jgi:hypothetical protein